MIIDPKRLRKLREAKGLSRADLAAASNVSPKQIQRLEHPREASRSPRRVTVRRLATALGVKPEVLSGEESLSESDSPFVPRTVRVTHWLFSEALLAFDLVEKRYGVQATAIMNMAPLFFVLLAEGSLAWRRKELAEIKDALNAIEEMADGSNCRRFAVHASKAEQDSYYEDEAIRQRNLFNDPYSADSDSDSDSGSDSFHFGVNDDKSLNPFVEYLQKLSEDLDIPGIEVDKGFVSSSVVDNMPAYSVCRDELEKLVPLRSRAFSALQGADIRITDIPEELMPDSAAGQRREWLEGKLSPKTIRWLKERESFDSWLLEFDLLDAKKAPGRDQDPAIGAS